MPNDIVAAAVANDIPSIAFTYNDPIVFAEYAIDTANAASSAGVKSVAVTAGYLSKSARAEFFAPMAATNIDLKAMDENFYWRLTGGHLKDVLETISFVYHETDVWLELTNLVIPGYNDSDHQIGKLAKWVADELGINVPIHFSAFHPDFKMKDVPATPVATLRRARETAMEAGLKFVYTGNVVDDTGSSTWCPSCGSLLIERLGYQVGRINLNIDDRDATCRSCKIKIPGRF
jgi:pyruvate formate lyase activating enzyme